MFTTAITTLFNIQYPIIQGGLQGIGKADLAAAVSNAGGLGLLTAGSYSDKEMFRKAICHVREKTNNSFGVNLTIGIRQPMDEYVRVVLEEQVPIVFTSGNNPEKFMDEFKSAGITVTHVVPSVRFAKKAEEIGCDAVVVVGYECGGHPGTEAISSLTLIQRVVQEVNIPVIGAGGFSTGKSLVAALALGAAGVQMGTRFLLTKESPLHPKIKEKMIKLSEADTVFVKKSINKPMRVMRTELAEKIIEMEQNDCTIEELLPYIDGESYRKLIEQGDLEAGVISLGQTVGLINDLPSVETVIDRMMEQAREQLGLLGAIENA